MASASDMEQLRDVLNGSWVGSYGYEGRFQTIRTDTRFRLDCKISPSTGKLEITGKGNDFTGNFSFEGSATSPTEIRMTKLIGWLNNWWHTAKVDIDKKEMQGQWGPAWYPNKVDGSLIFQRQMTQEEIQREADAARQRADEARKKQEEEAARKEQEEDAAKAAAKQRQDEAAAARKKQEEEAAEAAARQKRDEEEVARKKPEEENEEAAKKQREDADATGQKAEEVNAASKKRAEQAVQPDLATKEREDAKRARQREAKQASQKGKKAQMTDRKAKPVVSMTDSEDGVAGNLKIHLKLDLDADIRVIATLRGDVAIGIM